MCSPSVCCEICDAVQRPNESPPRGSYSSYQEETLNLCRGENRGNGAILRKIQYNLQAPLFQFIYFFDKSQPLIIYFFCVCECYVCAVRRQPLVRVKWRRGSLFLRVKVQVSSFGRRRLIYSQISSLISTKETKITSTV